MWADAEQIHQMAVSSRAATTEQFMAEVYAFTTWLQESLFSAMLDVLPEEPIPEDRVHPLIQAYRKKEPWLEGRMAVTCHSAFYSIRLLPRI